MQLNASKELCVKSQALVSRGSHLWLDTEMPLHPAINFRHDGVSLLIIHLGPTTDFIHAPRTAKAKPALFVDGAYFVARGWNGHGHKSDDQ